MGAGALDQKLKHGQDGTAIGRHRGVPLIHPVAIIAIVCLILNDHVLKGRLPDVVTGKLSDVAGLIFFPLLLLTFVEAGLRLLRMEGPSRRWLLAACVIATAVVFTGVKLSTPVAHGYGDLLGWLRWPFLAFEKLCRGQSVPGHQRVVILADPTDLLALPGLAVAWLVARQPVRRRIGLRWRPYK